MRRRFFLIFICLTLRASSGRCADSLQILESGDFSYLKAMRSKAVQNNDLETAQYYDALEKFYQGNLDRAGQILGGAHLPENLPEDALWLKKYLAQTQPLIQSMSVFESEHFVLRAPERDSILKDYALDALEKAYRELGKDFGLYPENKIPVEIYPTREAFSKSSTLSMEILDRSGAIGICKFRRIMILSPEQLAYGYRWLDTLAHEYVHYLVNIKSRGQCPLWLHEGIAKYLETRWRKDNPDYLTPGNRTELVRAMKDDQLIPFARMEPSMVYLNGQEEVRRAFSQVSHAAGSIEKMKGRRAVMDILSELSRGKTRGQAFEAVLEMDDKKFEEKWRDILEKENLEESEGSAPDVIRLSGQSSEIDDLVSTEARAHIRLADRMKQMGKPDAALIQYLKALEREPNNPVALAKAARAYIAAGNPEAAVGYLERCVRENPNYPTGFILLGREMARRQRWTQARNYFEEANALNPFNPEVHESLAAIYAKLGTEETSKKEAGIAAQLLQR